MSDYPNDAIFHPEEVEDMKKYGLATDGPNGGSLIVHPARLRADPSTSNEELAASIKRKDAASRSGKPGDRAFTPAEIQSLRANGLLVDRPNGTFSVHEERLRAPRAVSDERVGELIRSSRYVRRQRKHEDKRCMRALGGSGGNEGRRRKEPERLSRKEVRSPLFREWAEGVRQAHRQPDLPRRRRHALRKEIRRKAADSTAARVEDLKK
ncbi:MAG: hypothetical protein M1828_006693 [Chrysothrix sp. TS-e1954]|nr:MAG: hypothetical protein M1828_006693 [Chrysothrix sp. TS-e1954]